MDAITGNPDAIRALRIRSGLGPVELARRAGINAATFWRIENNHAQPRVATLRKIADALDVPVTAITTRKDSAA